GAGETAGGARAEARGAPRAGARPQPRAPCLVGVERLPARADAAGGGRTQQPSPGRPAPGARERGCRRSRRRRGGCALVADPRAASASRPSRLNEPRSAGLARLNQPRRVLVEERIDGSPVAVNRQPVELVREEWRVLDRWWTEEPVARRYFEVVLESR